MCFCINTVLRILPLPNSLSVERSLKGTRKTVDLSLELRAHNIGKYLFNILRIIHFIRWWALYGPPPMPHKNIPYWLFLESLINYQLVPTVSPEFIIPLVSRLKQAVYREVHLRLSCMWYVFRELILSEHLYCAVNEYSRRVNCTHEVICYFLARLSLSTDDFELNFI